MTRRVVVPLNETVRSERALPVAVHLARIMEVPLVLLSVAYSPTSDHPGHPGYHENLLRAYQDIDAESVVVRTGGSTASAIASMCRPEDIICMGVDHTGPLSELLVGSVFFELVRTFHGPVVAVGPNAVIPADADRLLICLDGLPHATRGLDLIASFADPAHLTPFLVQAMSATEDRTASAPSHDTVESGYLQRIAADLRDSGGGHRTDIGWDVLHGDALAAIGVASNQPEVAFVGLATNAVDPLTRMLSPSMANELLRVSGRPLVLLSATARVVRSTIIPRAIPAVVAAS